MGDGVVSGSQEVKKFRIRTLRAALKLEMKGMTRRGESALSIVKREFGFEGGRRKVLEQLETYIKENNDGIYS